MLLFKCNLWSLSSVYSTAYCLTNNTICPQDMIYHSARVDHPAFSGPKRPITTNLTTKKSLGHLKGSQLSVVQQAECNLLHTLDRLLASEGWGVGKSNLSDDENMKAHLLLPGGQRLNLAPHPPGLWSSHPGARDTSVTDRGPHGATWSWVWLSVLPWGCYNHLQHWPEAQQRSEQQLLLSHGHSANYFYFDRP